MARETQGGPANEKKLEQYGVWVKVKPRTLTEAPALEDTFELSDLETPRATAVPASKGNGGSALTAEEEQLLDELETELVPVESAIEVAVPEEEPLLAEEAELPDIESVAAESPDIALGQAMEEDLPELEEESSDAGTQALSGGTSTSPETGEVEVTLSEGIEEEDHFDDLEALETELATVTSTASTVREPSAASAQILGRIEEELRSIRKDLTQLRTELSGLRKGAAEPTVETPAAGRTDAQGGFFDEDEDETIALTGDELDNILNTADVTEEVAETPRVDAEPALDLSSVEEPQEEAPADILGYDTGVLEDQKTAPSAKTDAVLEDELPTELVLDELSEEAPPEAESGLSVEDILDVDLEGIPEIETPLPSPPAASGQRHEEEDETIDLDTLDLGEEPKIINAVPEQLVELEDIPDAEAITDFEEIPEAEAVGESETAAEPVPSAKAGAEVEDLTDLDALAGLEAEEGLLPESEAAPDAGAKSAPEEELDLEALAVEAGELEEEKPGLPLEELEIGELETVAEAEPIVSAAEEEIEIDFESEPESAAGAPPSSAKDVEPVDLIQEIGEPDEEKPAAVPAASGAAGIPDNLKDEIRTVLKYMDTLLEALPDEKINEFPRSDYFVMYKKLFEDLGLGE